MKNKSNLAEALYEIKSDELRKIPSEDEIEYEFSDDFHKKAKRLIKSQNNSRLIKFLRLAGEIAAVFFIAIIVFIVATNTNASESKKFDFLYKIFNNIASIVSEPHDAFDLSNTTYYTLKYIPKNYKEIGFSTNPSQIKTVYENANDGNRIRFSQEAQIQHQVNTQGTYVEEFLVGDIKVLYIDNTDFITCYWVENDNYFCLSYSSVLGKELIYKNVGQLIERPE